MAKLEGFDFPDGLFYHPEHAWARLEADGTVAVGMNDFAQHSAGEISYVDLPFEGDQVRENETCAKIQTAKWVGKLASPVSGEVVAVNEDLRDDPTLINQSPYDRGWVVKIRPSDWEGERPKLMRDPGDIERWLKKEIQRVEAEKKGTGKTDG